MSHEKLVVCKYRMDVIQSNSQFWKNITFAFIWCMPVYIWKENNLSFCCSTVIFFPKICMIRQFFERVNWCMLAIFWCQGKSYKYQTVLCWFHCLVCLAKMSSWPFYTCDRLHFLVLSHCYQPILSSSHTKRNNIYTFFRLLGKDEKVKI